MGRVKWVLRGVVTVAVAAGTFVAGKAFASTPEPLSKSQRKAARKAAIALKEGRAKRSATRPGQG